LKEIAKTRGLTCDGSKIHVWPANQVGTVYAQMRGYIFMAQKAEEKKWNVGLFIVDSFNKKFRLAFAGREMYPARAQEFGRHLDYLEEFAKKFNSATLLTFQVGVTPSEDNKADQMEYSIENYPVGGTLVLHNVQTWISLKKIKGGAKSVDVFEANLFDHNYKPKGTIQYQITDQGVVDF
jgi:RecA/RadA recombinase